MSCAAFRWEGLAVGNTGSCSGDKATLCSLIQLSAGGWSCTPSLLVVWPEVTQCWSP